MDEKILLEDLSVEFRRLNSIYVKLDYTDTVAKLLSLASDAISVAIDVLENGK